MAGRDGWWAAPLAPPSPTRSLPVRAMIGGGFGVHGIAGEGGPTGAFAPCSTSGSFSSSGWSFNFGPAGVISAGRAKVEMECGGNAYAIQSGGAGEIMDAEVGFRDGEACPAGRRNPLPPLQQQKQKVPSPIKNGKSIAERRAERCGFSAPRINTAKFRCSGSPICSPAAVRSPCLTIPPGLSPTALLDSPVMLMNAQAQPSPTTGTFPSSLHNHETLATMPLKDGMGEGNSEALDSSFVFKLPLDPVSTACIQRTKSKVSSHTSMEHLGMNYIHSQTLAQMPMQTEYEGHAGFLGEILSKSNASDSQSDMEASDDTVAKGKNTSVPSCHPGISDETQLEEQRTRHGVSQHLQGGDQAGAFPSLCAGRPSDDGFNWRKYGQKQVKGSEYPRSYYKCTHPNCQVKKKVERSYDGQITEIIYKGKHNHPKPQPARRTIIGSSFPLNEMSETLENPGSSIKTEGESVWSNHHGSEEDRSIDCQPDGSERMSSTSAVTDLSDPLSTVIEKHLSELESTGNLDLSSTLACHDEDDQATQESVSAEGDDEDDKSDSKRRKNESYLIETSSASRAVREPRVVVQTESEVDILDDGYRWRKYGQKVVKGNPNPRSYYKCTNPGCSVRKHVERAAHDLKSVITTYEGKHNHEVPVARNSTHSGSSSGSFPPASNAESSMILPGSTANPEHSTSGKDLSPHFKRKLDLSNVCMKPSNPGSLCGYNKFTAPSCYETKLLQQLAFQPSGLSINQAELLQTSSVAKLSPEFPISFPMSIRRASSNAGLAGIDGNHGGVSGTAAQSLLGQQPNLMDLRFIKAPKQEEKDEAFCSSVFPVNNLAGASSPSLCGQPGFQKYRESQGLYYLQEAVR